MTMTTTTQNERTPEELFPASTDSETKDTRAARLLSHAAQKAQHAALSAIRHPAVVTAAVKRHYRLRNAMDVLLHRNNADNITFYGPQRERSVELKLSHMGELGARKGGKRCANLVGRKACKLGGVNCFIEDVLLV